jgi:hypothetical protein
MISTELVEAVLVRHCWEVKIGDSPASWPQRFQDEQNFRTDGRPTAQWSRLKAGYSDDLGTASH